MSTLFAGQRVIRHSLRNRGHSRALSAYIPCLDLSLANTQTFARELDAVCSDTGFFTIKNHGVDELLVKRVTDTTRKFFDLPEADKRSENLQMTGDYPFGYLPLASETLSAGKAAEQGETVEAPADLNESFSVGPYDPASGMASPRWPQQPDVFASDWLAYYKEMESLSAHLLRCFAMALELPEEWFDDKIDRHRSALRALNYPEPPPGSHLVPGQLRASAHTDYGSLTILLPDSAPGGLQVLAKSGEWTPVPYVAGTFVINLGDLMARWTNDRWASTMHRVVLPSPDCSGRSRRQSLAYFQNVNADQLITAIPTCHGPDNPPKFEPITAGELLAAKHAAATQGRRGNINKDKA